MRYYGYIKDKNKFTPQGSDRQWTFVKDGEDYNGIETSRDLSKDSNVVIIGTDHEFKLYVIQKNSEF